MERGKQGSLRFWSEMGECFDSPWWSSELACNRGLLQSVHFITLSSNESASCKLSRFESLSNLGESANGSDWVSGVAPPNAVYVSCGQSMDRVTERWECLRLRWDCKDSHPSAPVAVLLLGGGFSFILLSPLVLSEWWGKEDETARWFGQFIRFLFPCSLISIIRLFCFGSNQAPPAVPIRSHLDPTPLPSSLLFPPRHSFTFPFQSSTSKLDCNHVERLTQDCRTSN